MIEKERLNQVINIISDKFNISDKKDIAVKLGIEQTYFSAMLGGSKKISGNLLEKLQAVFGVSRSWLKTGEGEMFIRQTTPYQHYINNSGNFCENVINSDLSNQISELIAIQRNYQEMIKEKDKQINDLIEILKGPNKNA